MGRGDRRTKKGKRTIGTFGKSRSARTGMISAAKKAGKKAEVKAD
jgi:ribosomal small subunit protein bTHX